MKDRTKRILRTTFNIIKAVAIVVSPHTFVAKVAEVLTAIEAANHRKR